MIGETRCFSIYVVLFPTFMNRTAKMIHIYVFSMVSAAAVDMPSQNLYNINEKFILCVKFNSTC